MLLEPQAPLFTGHSSSAPPPSQSDPIGAPAAEDEGHDVRFGRPDFAALVREAAVGREKQRVVVAACGPEPMVAAARKAVAAARKDCRGVHLEFSGGESRW